MDLAIQLIANNKTVRSETVQDSKAFETQSPTTQAKKANN